MIIFWGLTGLTLICLLSRYNELLMLKKIQAGIYVSDQDVYINDLSLSLVIIFQFLLRIASIIVFLSWFRRAYGNLHRLGIKYLLQKELMAVWVWFIPIVWFYRPVQIMNEIWTETQKRIKDTIPKSV